MHWLVKLSADEQNIWDKIKEHGPTELIWTELPEKRRIGRWPEGRNDINEYYRRKHFTENYSWAVPTQKVIDDLKRFVGNDTVLEIGSGKGLWAYLLKSIGINVIATDIKKYQSSFTDIEEMDSIKAVNKYLNANVLMFIWPSYDESWAYEALKNFHGNKVIYIGEGVGGCTGDDNLCNLLSEKFQLINDTEDNLLQWHAIYDRVYLYTRK